MSSTSTTDASKEGYDYAAVNTNSEYSEEALINLSRYWYCTKDSSKYVEHVEGYMRNNTGLFTISLDNEEKYQHTLNNAVAMKKLPENKIEFVKELISEMKAYPLPGEPACQRTEVHLLQVECPICNKVTIAPKIPVYGLDRVRNSQVKTIKHSIEEVADKYDMQRKLLGYKFFLLTGGLLLVGVLLTIILALLV